MNQQLLQTIASYRLPRPSAVLHIGANTGQEAGKYSRMQLPGYHVEALPDVFEILKGKCAEYADQHAIMACLSDEAGKEISFNVANNRGHSSSILPLGRHAAAYPTVKYSDSIELRTDTVDGLVGSGVIPRSIQFVVIDVQGAEILVLKGARDLLASGRLVGLQVEVSAEALYEGGANFLEVCAFLRPFGFFVQEVTFNKHGWGDAVFLKEWWSATVQTSGVNIALDRPCRQSSVSHWSKGADEASNVTKGARTGGFSFHTGLEDQPWIIVDLESIQDFDEIIIFNRLDVPDRVSDLTVDLSDNGVDWSTVHHNKGVFGGIDGHPLRVACNAMRARYVRVMSQKRTYLHLDSIEIYRFDR